MKKIIPSGAILIPDEATCVFHGVIFDVYQWQQTMFDGSVRTFEMAKRPDTIQVMVIRDGKILLVKDEQPNRGVRIHLPGGRADEVDGDWPTAAARELREETGLVCRDLKLIDVVQPEVKLEWFGTLFLGTDIIGEHEAELDPGGEKIDLIWEDYEEVRRQVLTGETPSMRYLLQFFNRVPTAAGLLALPQFEGQAVDR